MRVAPVNQAGGQGSTRTLAGGDGGGQGTTVEPMVGMNWHCFSVVVT